MLTHYLNETFMGPLQSWVQWNEYVSIKRVPPCQKSCICTEFLCQHCSPMLQRFIGGIVPLTLYPELPLSFHELSHCISPAMHHLGPPKILFLSFEFSVPYGIEKVACRFWWIKFLEGEGDCSETSIVWVIVCCRIKSQITMGRNCNQASSVAQ